MRKSKNNKVSMQVSALFFDNVFEPKRKEIQKQLGLANLTQIEFTSMINNIRIRIKKPRQSKKFMPKKRQRFSL